MAAKAPEELHALIEAAFNDQDVEAMLDLYGAGVRPRLCHRTAGTQAASRRSGSP